MIERTVLHHHDDDGVDPREQSRRGARNDWTGRTAIGTRPAGVEPKRDRSHAKPELQCGAAGELIRFRHPTSPPEFGAESDEAAPDCSRRTLSLQARPARVFSPDPVSAGRINRAVGAPHVARRYSHPHLRTSVIAVGALIAALWTMEAVPVVPLSPLPDDPVEVPENIQSRPAQHPYLRTAFEEFLIIGVGSIWYWRHPAKNSWELQFDWTDWRAKMFSTRMIVFDNDLFATNGLAHPFAGAIYYQVARGNGLSPLASLVASFLTSTAWEYLGRVGREAVDQRPDLHPRGRRRDRRGDLSPGAHVRGGEPQHGQLHGRPALFAHRHAERGARLSHGREAADRRIRVAGAHLALSGVQPRPGLLLVRRRRRSAPRWTWVSASQSSIIMVTDSREPGSGAVAPGEWTRARPGRTSSPTAGCGASGFMPAAAWWGATTATTRPPDETARRETDGWGLMLGLGSTFDFDSRVLPLEWDRVGDGRPGRAHARVFQPTRGPHHPRDAAPRSTASRW